LWNNFPKAMEGLESKRKRLNIDDGESRVVDQSPFTSFVLTRNYEVKIHVDVDDFNICFILWIHEGMLVSLNFISFHHFFTFNDNHWCLNHKMQKMEWEEMVEQCFVCENLR
jgi:hypothetical protein